MRVQLLIPWIGPIGAVVFNGPSTYEWMKEGREEGGGRVAGWEFSARLDSNHGKVRIRFLWIVGMTMKTMKKKM